MSLPTNIQAITFAKNGGVEVLEKTSVPFPQQKPGDIVAKVVYGGVNMIDTYFRKGLYPAPSFPQVSGVEASGVIVKLPTDPAVLENKWYKLRDYKIGDRVAINGQGAHAEYISKSWKDVYPLPNELSLEIGAGILSHGLTVLTLMTEAYNVKKGDTILIHTVAGGLGLLFAAYAKSRGATVIGTTSTPEKAEIAKSYGADHVILYTKENTVERVLEITKGEGVHAVFDGVGKDTFLANFDLLRRKGTLVAVGNASGAPEPISPLKLAPKNLKLVRPSMGNYIVTPEEAHPYFVELVDALRSGLFKIRIEKTFPFTAEGAQAAQTELATPGNKIAGKLLIKIGEE
ncbi:NAD-P-binding protein [Cytidiella melzeri]|nr:NAD-P-binding protein [Cytidiella melzeri]